MPIKTEQRLIYQKRHEFVEHYLKTGSAREAALHIGYSKNSAKQDGSGFLHLDYIDSMIRARREKIIENLQEETQSEFEYCKIKLKEIIESAINIGSYFNVAVSAIAELNKMFGHYAPEKSEQTVSLLTNQVDELVAKYKSEF